MSQYTYDIDIFLRASPATPDPSPVEEQASGVRETNAKHGIVEGAHITTDFWLSKLFYDLQKPALAAAYRTDPDAVLTGYPLADDVRQALRENDVRVLAPRVNAYLLRYYFGIIGMADDAFIAKIRESG